MDDNKFMDIAYSEAKKALVRGDYPAGCVIVKNGKVITKASSRGITSKDATAHAEMQAISDACQKMRSRFLQDCVVYTNIEPCLMCAKAMVYASIKKVVYGAEHKEYENKKTFDILKQNDIGKYIQFVSGCQKQKAHRLLKIFLAKHPDFLRI